MTLAKTFHHHHHHGV